jgi:CAAX protease family protein
LAYSAIIVPIAEELLFRGVIFRWLWQRLSFWPAAVASSALFGLAHVWIDSIVAAGAMGLVLAWLYERSRSLAPSILMHQTFNAAIVAAALAIEWLGLAGS